MPFSNSSGRSAARATVNVSHTGTHPEPAPKLDTSGGSSANTANRGYISIRCRREKIDCKLFRLRWHICASSSQSSNPPANIRCNIKTPWHKVSVTNDLLHFISAYSTFREHPQGLKVLDDVAALVGHQQQEQVLDRLVHVPYSLRFDEGVLLVACHASRTSGERAHGCRTAPTRQQQRQDHEQRARRCQMY